MENNQSLEMANLIQEVSLAADQSAPASEDLLPLLDKFWRLNRGTGRMEPVSYEFNDLLYADWHSMEKNAIARWWLRTANVPGDAALLVNFLHFGIFFSCHFQLTHLVKLKHLFYSLILSFQLFSCFVFCVQQLQLMDGRVPSMPDSDIPAVVQSESTQELMVRFVALQTKRMAEVALHAAKKPRLLFKIGETKTEIGAKQKE